MSNTKGQAIIIVIAILIVFSLLIPFNIFMVQNESRWTIKEKRSTTAFHLAEAGLDRGYWKLKEKSSYWTDIIKGTPIPGYNFDVVYDDIPSSGSASIGYYTIKITTGDESGEVKIYSIAKDKTNNETRALEAIYNITNAQNAMTISGILSYQPNLEVNWGPIVCYESMDTTPANRFPRHICKGSIKGWDEDPNNPNTDDKSYAAFQDLGPKPQIDWGYYAAEAKKCSIPNPGTAATPAKSAYFENSVTFFKYGSSGYTFKNSTTVVYIAGTSNSVALKNGCWLQVRAIVCEGNCDFNAKANTYKAVIPPLASDEYLHPDAATKWAMFNPPGNGGTYNFTDAGMVGFLCIKGSMSGGSGNAGVIGSLYIGGNITANTFTVYYSSSVGSDVQLASTNPRRISWKEVLLGWPSWL